VQQRGKVMTAIWQESPVHELRLSPWMSRVVHPVAVSSRVTHAKSLSHDAK
jgi:hypothetical protein